MVEILTFWFEIIMNQEVKNWGTTFKNSHVMFLKDLLNSFKINDWHCKIFFSLVVGGGVKFPNFPS